MPKTLNDIIPPSRRAKPVEVVTETRQSELPSSYEPSYPRLKRRFPLGTILVALGVVVISGGVLFLFSHAEVAVTPKSTQVSVEGIFTASLSSGDLPYQVISVEKTESDSIPAESTETVYLPAQGTLTIYNEQAVSQALIKNTRFESKDGHIFRIRESVKVPAGTKATPGTVQAMVYADENGPDYNIGATTFTVPGLKGGKSYAQVYAKSDKSMEGGFSGTRPTASKAAVDAKRVLLDISLDAELETALAEKIPQGYIVLPGSSLTSHEAITGDANEDTSSVVVQEKATVHAIVFSEEALARAVAYKTVGQYQGEPLSLKDTKDLVVTFAQNEQPWADGKTTLSFGLKGNTTFIWKVVAGKIAGAVAGKTPEAAKIVLTSGGFTEVGSARIVLRPFWRSTFPEDPTAINVTVEEAK